MDGWETRKMERFCHLCSGTWEEGPEKFTKKNCKLQKITHLWTDHILHRILQKAKWLGKDIFSPMFQEKKSIKTMIVGNAWRSYGRRQRRKGLLCDFSRGTKLTFSFSENKRRNKRLRENEQERKWTTSSLWTLFYSCTHSLIMEQCVDFPGSKGWTKFLYPEKRSVSI